jgi:ankyrin repeat protein
VKKCGIVPKNPWGFAMKQTMNRDICAQIDARLVVLFDSIPDAGNKTPTEFFSAVFSDEANSRKALNNWPRTFVHNIMASKIPASEEMALAIIELILTKHRYLDGLINVGDNLVALACESGSTARIESVLRTGAGRGRIAEIDDQGRLKIFKTSTDNLHQLEAFFREWRSVGKNKSLFDYLIDPKVGPNLSKVHSDSWKTLERIFPDKTRDINQLRGYNPDLLINAYRLGGVNKLEQVLRTSSGMACLTEVDAEGKLKIFGSKLERFSELEEYFRKLIFNPNNMCFLDICLAAESRKDNPVQFHPSVWQVLRKIFVANINKIQEAKKDNTRWRNNSSEAENDFIYNDLPESAEELNKKTENDILNGFEESLAAGTPEAALRAFAVDASGRTPLHLAAEQGNVDLVTKILASQIAIDSVYVNTAVLFRNAHPYCLAKMFEVPQLVKLAYHALSGSDYNYTLVKEIFARDRALLNEQKVKEFVNAGNAEALRAVAEIDKELFVRAVTSGVNSAMCPRSHRYQDHVGYYDEKTFPKLKTLFGLIRDHAPELLNSFFAVRGGNGLGVMHYAAYVGDVDFVRSMYATDAGKAAIKATTERGATTIRIAIVKSKENVAMIEELLTYPEVVESVGTLDKDDRNIFHLFENSSSRVHPEILKVILRKVPESRKLLSQKNKDQRSPVSVFTAEHLQALIEVNNELQDLSIISGCEADLITLSIRSKNLALLPAIAATEAGQAALKALDSDGILPLTSALHSGDLELVKQLLQYPAVQESIEILDDRQESIFNASRFYYGAKPISPEILEYVLENYLQSRKLLSGTTSKNPVADFSLDTLKVALKYSEGAEALFAKGRGELCFAQDILKAYSTSNQYPHVGSQEKAQAVIEALKNYPDRDKARAIFTQKINGKKFIDTLNDEQRAIIPIELITLELDLGTIAAFVGMIRCASSQEQAIAVLNDPDENGLSVYSRVSREQRAILDSAFTVSPAVHSVLAAASNNVDTAAEHASSTSLQTGAHGNADGVVVSTASIKKRSSSDDLQRERDKSARTGDVVFKEGRGD